MEVLKSRLESLINHSDIIYVSNITEDYHGQYEQVTTYVRKRDQWKMYYNEIGGSYEVLESYMLYGELLYLLMTPEVECTVTGFYEFCNDYEETDFISYVEFQEEFYEV